MMVQPIRVAAPAIVAPTVAERTYPTTPLVDDTPAIAWTPGAPDAWAK